FAALSSIIDIRLFVLNPCREYWDDIVSEKKLTRKAARSGKRRYSLADMHMESGNPLLASLGDHGREFLGALHNLDCEEHPCFTRTDAETLLEHVQNDLLTLDTPGKHIPIQETDCSIQLHSCHSPMREVEVLHDRLLSFLDNDPSLSPSDIVVMMPDIETYAPCIQAVFEAELQHVSAIPFSLADRSIRSHHRVVDDFLLLLDLIESSFSAPDVIALVESPFVQQCFSFSDSDISVIREWVDATRICWGIDRDHRRSEGISPTHENTWRAGIDRLLLGYAMGTGDDRMVKGILPSFDAQSLHTAALGNLAEFMDRLYAAKQTLSGRLSLSEWSACLLAIVDRFFAGTEKDRSATLLTTVLTDLSNQQHISRFNDLLPLEVIRQQIDAQLTAPLPGSGFLSGGVTFCSMLPMRSIPFRIVCILGLDDRSYPRIDKKPHFDLTVRYPREGDRNLRKDDRYLFLETLLSARDTLYLSYTGRNADDNGDSPPSVVVSELLDYCDRFYRPAAKKHLSLREQLLIRHPLHPFSARYFRGDSLTTQARLFSYSSDNYEAAASRMESRKRSMFLPSMGPVIAPKQRLELSVDQLCGFFRHPIRTFLRTRFGIRLEIDHTIIGSEEPFELDTLDRYAVEQFLLEKALQGATLHKLYEVVQSMGILPHGTIGRCHFDRLVVNVKHVAQIIGAASQNSRMYADVKIHTDSYTLRGRLNQLTDNYLLRYRYAQTRPKDKIDTWIRHILLNAAPDPTLPRTSMHIGTKRRYVNGEKREFEQTLVYHPVEHAGRILDELVEIYRIGMEKGMHFFTDSSHTYAESILIRRRYAKEALQHALKTWQGNGFSPGECEDPYHSLYFGEHIPLDKDFAALAMAVYEPLYRHEREGELQQ
ncbi:MAG: exodeoxyribonuclease V subunit gamma, partial [Chitinivibrionales bacterium]